jgi:exosortase E/protease (VPEID-CTERM system)
VKRAAATIGANDAPIVPDASFSRVVASRFLPHVGLLVLLIAELLYLTIRADTQSLDRIPGLWPRLIGWTPVYLRLALTSFVVAVLVAGKEMGRGIHDCEPRFVRFRSRVFALHLCALAAFTWITGVVMAADFRTTSSQGLWAVAWVTAGIATLVLWALSAFRSKVWLATARRGQLGIFWGFAVGSAALGAGFLSQDSWKPLAGHTFQVVAWMVGWVYSDTDLVNEPATFVLGTPTFSVNIAPECSGYEGIGLIVTFLGVYLWLFRARLQFPRALILLPLGAAAVWILNAARIAALIVIGSSGWPEVATGGFHSQAGWLLFNAVALGFVALSLRGRYFMTAVPSAPADTVAPSPTADPTAAYLSPLLVIVATSMITGAFSTGFDWLYPARVLAAGVALWVFRGSYGELKWRWSWGAIAIGIVVFLIWVALMPTEVHDKDAWPAALGTIPPGWAALWLVIRVLGYVVTVPVAEELAFRGFLPRRLLQPDFSALPVTTFSWLPVALSSLLFGALHGQFWIAGTIAGALYAMALYRGRALGDAVQAHATTNALMVLYVFATGHWSAWS